MSRIHNVAYNNMSMAPHTDNWSLAILVLTVLNVCIAAKHARHHECLKLTSSNMASSNCTNIASMCECIFQIGPACGA